MKDKNFAIYNYEYIDASMDGTFFADAPPPQDPVPVAERYKHLSPLFGERKDSFVLKGNQKDEIFPCTVILNQDGIVMLLLERPKDLDVWKKLQTPPGEFPKFEKGTVPSNPFCYVCIDCRQGHNKIAIEINSSAWRKTDTVKVLLAMNINMLLNNKALGFNIRIQPETYSFDFLEQGRWHIKKNNRTVKWMTIHWNRGLIDPQLEAEVQHSQFFKYLFNLFSSMEGDVTLKNPNVSGLLRKKAKLAEFFTLLIGSEESDAFGVKWTLDNNRSYEWGEDIRINFPMEDHVLKSALGEDRFFPDHRVDKWFDRLENGIEEEKNATNPKRRRTRKNP